MYKFVQRVNEIRNILIRFRVIEVALDSMILFLTAFLIFPYLGIKPGWMMFVPSLIYAVIQLKCRFNTNIVKKIEEFYPALKERLSTVYDNREEKNVVVEDLASSVLTDMEQVRYSSFISTKRLGIRIAVILMLVTFMLLTAFINPSVSERASTPAALLSSQANTDRITGSPDTDTNESSFVRIGNDTQGLLLYRGQASELNLPGGKQAAEYSRLFPGQERPAAISSGIYGETIPPIYQEIVKNYFTNLTSLD